MYNTYNLHLPLMRYLWQVCQILPRFTASRMGINLRFKRRLMATNPECVFSEMAVLVMSGLNSGESVALECNNF